MRRLDLSSSFNKLKKALFNCFNAYIVFSDYVLWFFFCFFTNNIQNRAFTVLQKLKVLKVHYFVRKIFINNNCTYKNLILSIFQKKIKLFKIKLNCLFFDKFNITSKLMLQTVKTDVIYFLFPRLKLVFLSINSINLFLRKW